MCRPATYRWQKQQKGAELLKYQNADTLKLECRYAEF